MFLASLVSLGPGMPLGPGIAAGAGIGYSVLSQPLVADDTVASLGTLYAEFTAGQIKKGDTVTIKLPEDFEFRGHETSPGVIDTTKKMEQSDWKLGYAGDESVMSGVYYLGNGSKPSNSYYPNGFDGYNYILCAQKKGADEPNGMYKEGWSHPSFPGCRVPFMLYQTDDNEIKIEIIDTPDPGEDVFFYIYFGAIYIDSGYSGEIKLTADSPSGSGFGSGQITIGRATEGKVTVEATEVESFSDEQEVTLRIKEDVAGALDVDSESLNLVLPSGFAWKSGYTVRKIWGDKQKILVKDNNGLTDNLKITPDDDELKFDVKKCTQDPICFEVKATLEVDDETVAKTGDVTARIKGDSDVTVSEVIVGRYGEYGSKIEATSSPKLIAGMVEQQIGDIKITEDVEASLEEGRTIILTLPSNAKWGKNIDEDSDSGVKLEFAGFPGSDGREAKWKVVGKSTDAAELILEDMEIVLEPGVEGDIEIEVSGTASLTGDKIKVGEAVKSVSAKAENVPDVKIGLDQQEGGDILITENIAGAIKEDFDAKLVLDLPDGVKFATVPKVEVTEGDLDIDEAGVKRQAEGSQSDNQLVIPIDGESTKASTIKVSGIKYTVDRTVPEGGITVKVKGSAVNEVNHLARLKDYFGTVDKSTDIGSTTTAIARDTGGVYLEGELAYLLDNDMIWPQSQTAASVVNATVITPAPGEVKPGTAVFKIGDTKYTVGDKEETMDVAPYVKNNRTYLPIRYVGYALGVSASNILWDNANATATIIKGDRVVQVKIGSKVMLINGAAITMDVAPEIKDGRTMLPFRWIAQALGASVEWDEATQTVTVKL
jgi:hypothetical protein